MMSKQHYFFKRQGSRGFALTEALVGLAIFMIGITGLIAMQADLLSQNRNAVFQLQANLLANELVSMAIADAKNKNCYTVPVAAQVACGSVAAKTFTQNWVNEISSMFPGTSANLPTASIDVNEVMTVNISWKRTNDISLHHYVATTKLES